MNLTAAASSRPKIGARPTLHASMALLDSVASPASDLTQRHLEHFFYCGAREAPTALVGVELFGRNALLRSLVVAPSSRGAGVGSALVEHAENYARTLGVRAMYLLTMTAEGFFARRGYLRIARGSAVPEIQATSEFTLLCPDSSVLMVKAL